MAQTSFGIVGQILGQWTEDLPPVASFDDFSALYFELDFLRYQLEVIKLQSTGNISVYIVASPDQGGNDQSTLPIRDMDRVVRLQLATFKC